VALILVVFTAICAASVPAVVSTWRGQSTAAALPGYSLFAFLTRRKDRIRAGPSAAVSAYVLCLASWVVFLVGPADDPSVTVTVVVLALVGLWLASLLGIATVALFNRPKFLAPPHLRRQWGSLRARRSRRRRARTPVDDRPA
jgi:hypothetical protein